VERVRSLRERRDQAAWAESLKKVEEAARSSNQADNLMPHILHAVESSATVGEISDTLRKVFGEFQEVVVV